MDPEILMRHAIQAAQQGIAKNQSPFGCAIALGDHLVVASHNIVRQSIDISAHAEITAIRQACRILNEILLEDCIVATTCEPCPMCTSALHWARVRHVYYGATITDAANVGFNELKVDAATLLKTGGSQVTLTGGVLTDQCKTLFQTWSSQCGDPY